MASTVHRWQKPIHEDYWPRWGLYLGLFTILVVSIVFALSI